MKTLCSKLWLLAIGLGILAPACQEEDRTAVLRLESETMTVSAEGGSASVSYTLENAPDGTEINAVSEKEWIREIDTRENGVIRFTVDANDNAVSRSSKVEVTCSATTERYSFTVTQEAGDPPVFAFEIVEASEAAVKFNIYPADKEMTYIGMVVSQEKFDSFGSDDAYFKDDFDYFKMMAEINGLTMEEYLQGILKQGDAENRVADQLKPGTAYYVYAYGMSAQGERLTDIYKTETRTKAVEPVDMDFEIDVKVDCTNADVSVVPSDKEHAYMFDVFTQRDAGSVDGLKEFFQENLDLLVSIYTAEYEMTVEEVMEQLSSHGPDSHLFEGLEANTPYYVIAVAVTPFGTLNSEVTSKEFTSGNATRSDNDITVAFSQIQETTVDYKIRTTNDDPYVFGYDLASNWAGYTYDQMLEKLTSGEYQLDPLVVKGDQDGTLEGLTGKTDYIVFLFGYEGGAATTELVIGHFTTTGPQSDQVTFRLAYDKYFDGTKMAEAYPEKFKGAAGKVVVPVVAETTGDAAGFYYGQFRGDYTSPESLSDTDAINTVVFTGSSEPTNIFYLDYDQIHTFLGVASDKEGNYGPVWRAAFTPTPDGVSPVEEYEDPAGGTASSRLSRRLLNKAE